MTISDQIIGFEIFSAQNKLDEYKDIFADVVRDGDSSKLDQFVCEQVARTLLKFKSDENQRDVLDMCDVLKDRISDSQIRMSGKLFDSIAMQYTETQQWSKLLNLINGCTHENCDPTSRTMSQIKKNLVYCFDTSVRGSLKESLDTFEHKFFSNAGREQRRLQKERLDRQQKAAGAANQKKAAELDVEEAVIESQPEAPTQEA